MNKIPTKRISQIFHLLKINRIMLFSNLFMGWPSYIRIGIWRIEYSKQSGMFGRTASEDCNTVDTTPTPLWLGGGPEKWNYRSSCGRDKLEIVPVSPMYYNRVLTDRPTDRCHPTLWLQLPNNEQPESRWQVEPCVQFSGGISHRRYSGFCKSWLVTDAVLIRQHIQHASSSVYWCHTLYAYQLTPLTLRLVAHTSPPLTHLELILLDLGAGRQQMASHMDCCQLKDRKDDMPFRCLLHSLEFLTVKNWILHIKKFLRVSSLVNIPKIIFAVYILWHLFCTAGKCRGPLQRVKS